MAIIVKVENNYALGKGIKTVILRGQEGRRTGTGKHPAVEEQDRCGKGRVLRSLRQDQQLPMKSFHGVREERRKGWTCKPLKTSFFPYRE